jgi:hypothetical protein
MAVLAAAVVVAAGVGAGIAFALKPHSTVSFSALRPTVAALDDPTGSMPNGWTKVTELPSQTGTTAGFSIAMPPGWQESQSGQRYFLSGPDGAFMEIDLTKHANSDMVAEANYIKQQDLNSGNFPQFHQNYLIYQQVRGTTGAFWQYLWQLNGVPYEADDILFVEPTPAGDQSYSLYFRSPRALWVHTYVPIFQKMLRTFQTNPQTS